MFADSLRALSRPGNGKHHVVSCYVRLEPGDRTRRKYLIKLKEATARADQAVEGLAPTERRAIRKDLRRLVEAVEQPRSLPAAPGLALFACGPLGLFEEVPMPRVHHTRVVVDTAPQVTELMSVAGETGRILAAVFDRERARFFDVGAFEATEIADVPGFGSRGGRYRSDRHGSPGTGEHAYHGRIEEERHKHFARVAERLAELDRTHPASGVMLAGTRDETKAAERFLPRALESRYLGAVHLNPTAVTPAQVREAALELRRGFEERHEAGLVRETLDKVGEGWALNGAQASLQALARGQVRVLLVRDDAKATGYRCPATGRLSLSKTGCRGEGTPVPVGDLINEAVEEALRQGVEVSVIHDPVAREEIDGFAALLRFRGPNR